MIKNLLITAFVLVFAFSVAAKEKEVGPAMDLSKKIPDIEKKVSQYVPIEMKVDLSYLKDNQKKVLQKLVEASTYIDKIFLRQSWSKNPELRQAIAKDTKLDKNYLEFFDIMYGPIDRNDQKPFIGGLDKPKGAGFYPEDMTKEEFTAWIKAHPSDEKAFTSITTVIKRDGNKLVAVPYHVEYKQWLEPASKLMKEAAALTENASLKKFLVSRADAFLSDDYYQSDIDWMDIKDSPIEITIGPYEVYEDDLFNYKAAYESYVTVVNPKEGEKLQVYQKYLKELDQNLPIPDKYKAPRDKYESPLRIVEVVYAAGDGKKGVQTIAFNLPNDVRVQDIKGSKKVLLQNMMQAKFEKIFTRVAKEVLDQDQTKYLSSDTFVLETLQHEMAHGIGPRAITLSDGTKTTANLALKDKWSTWEEAKADVVGLYDIFYLIDKGVVAKSVENSIVPTYLANIFRAVRWGTDAHGLGMMMQFNYLVNKGVISYDKATKKFRVNMAKVRTGIKDLAHDLLMVEATGDYDKAVAMLTANGKAPEEVTSAIARLSVIPLDVKPVYVAIK